MFLFGLGCVLFGRLCFFLEEGGLATWTTTQRQPGVVDTGVIGSSGEFDEDPMKRTDRLFKQRSYLGAVDQLHELEPTMTEDSPAQTQRDAQHTDVLHTRDDRRHCTGVTMQV